MLGIILSISALVILYILMFLNLRKKKARK